MKRQVKIRKSWGVTNPFTRRVENKNFYNRKEKWGKNWKD